MTGQCSFRCPDSFSTVIPSMPGLPSLPFTRRSACLQFSRSQTSSIHCSVAGLSALRSANSDSVPSTKAIGAAPLLSSGKARRYWLFCRLSVVELRCVLIAPFIPLRGPFGPSLLAQLSGRRRRTRVLASVRRSNCTYGFPVCSFHENSAMPRDNRRN